MYALIRSVAFIRVLLLFWGGYPYFGHFYEILGISGENGVQSWPPQGIQVSRENGTPPFGVISEVLPRANFVLLAGLGPKLALGRTSEMTPEAWCTVFSAGLGSLGGQYGTQFSPEIPKIAKKCPKMR